MAHGNWMFTENITTCLVTAVACLFIFCLLRWKKSSHIPDHPQSAGFIRYLNSVERLFACMQDRKSCVLNFTLVIGSERKLSLDLIKRSSAEWIKRHQMLRARIATDSVFYRHAYFVEVNNENLINLPVKQVVGDDWKLLHEDQMMEAFDSTSGLLWRLAFAPNINHGFMSKMTPANIQRGMGDMLPNEDCDKFGFENVLVFRFLHCFTDGVGGISLIKDFIDVLNYLLTGNNNTTKIQHSSQDLYACIGKPSLTQTICMWLLSLPVPFVSNILEKMIKRPNFLEESDGLRLGVGVKDGGKWRLNVIHLTESETLRLRESCKLRGFICRVSLKLQLEWP